MEKQELIDLGFKKKGFENGGPNMTFNLVKSLLEEYESLPKIEQELDG